MDDPAPDDEAMREGGCQCGAIRYAFAAPVLYTFVCHCSECRKQSASAFGVSCMVPFGAFRVTRGEPRHWSRISDAGTPIDSAFCPTCGTRVWDGTPGATDTVCIKGGSLDRPVDLHGAIHIWTASRAPGVVVPDDAPQFPGEPHL